MSFKLREVKKNARCCCCAHRISDVSPGKAITFDRKKARPEHVIICPDCIDAMHDSLYFDQIDILTAVLKGAS